MPACQLKWRPEGKWGCTFPRGPLSCSPMFKRVLDCWSSSATSSTIRESMEFTLWWYATRTPESLGIWVIPHILWYGTDNTCNYVHCTATRTCLALFNVQEGLWLQVIPRLLPPVAHCPQSQVYNIYTILVSNYPQSQVYNRTCCTTARTWHRYSSHEQQFQMWHHIWDHQHYKMRHVYGTKCGTCEWFSFVV